MIIRTTLALLASLVLVGCDDTFSPIEASSVRFSIVGYFDASADTQWVRVTPLRPLVLTTPDPLGATVTLRHLGTDRAVELRDSVFRFEVADPELGSEGVFVHNYWTTEPIEPGASYRLTISEGGAILAETAVEIPPDYDLEVWVGQSGEQDLLHVRGLGHVGPMFVLTHFQDGCGSDVARTAVFVPSGAADSRLIPLRRDFGARTGCGATVVLWQDVWIAGSGEPWPEGPDGPGALGVLDLPRTISNAIGYIGGVLTRSIPYERCTIVGTAPPEHCVLRYDEGWATLSGLVYNGRCAALPLSGASVTMRELDPENPAQPRIRPTTTGFTGRFMIRGLLPNRRYELTVQRRGPTPLTDFYDHTDTLRFAVAESRSYDVPLEPKACPA